MAVRRRIGLSDRGMDLSGTTVALQEFGNVGSHAARLIAERGGKVVAVADHMGAVSNDAGLDVPALVAWAAEHRTVHGFAGGDAFDGAEIMAWPADVLIPATLEDAIKEKNAPQVKAKVIVEAANAPTTQDANAILKDAGVMIVPDILANAGGVTVSYFEWAQNIQQFRWELERVNSELEKSMRRAYASVRDVAKEKNVDLRTAAFVLAIQRVGRAGLSRRAIPWAKRSVHSGFASGLGSSLRREACHVQPRKDGQLNRGGQHVLGPPGRCRRSHCTGSSEFGLGLSTCRKGHVSLLAGCEQPPSSQRD
ncbi:MAG: hypothetical protein GY937_14245 [bacterium]|nr:hypothetical protein [bacterium]